LTLWSVVVEIDRLLSIEDGGENNSRSLVWKTCSSPQKRKDELMHAAEKIESAVPESLTWAEIRVRYPDQFVCLADVDLLHPNGLDFRTAKVIGAGATRAEAFHEADAWRGVFDDVQLDYTGASDLPYIRPAMVDAL
jgi:hypothetical protein